MFASKEEKYADRVVLAEELLIPRMKELITRYATMAGLQSRNDEKPTIDKELEALVPIIVLVLTNFLAFDQQQVSFYYNGNLNTFTVHQIPSSILSHVLYVDIK